MTPAPPPPPYTLTRDPAMAKRAAFATQFGCCTAHYRHSKSAARPTLSTYVMDLLSRSKAVPQIVPNKGLERPTIGT